MEGEVRPLVEEKERVQPSERPLYTVAEAARYLEIPVSTVRSWISGRRFPTSEGLKESPPVIRLPEPEGGNRLSLSNLVELYVLRTLRTQHAVRLQDIRKALDYAERELGIERLLIHPELKTTGGDLFLEYYGQLISLNRSGQLALKEVLKEALERVVWENDHPVRLFLPVPMREGHKSVFIDPRVRYGRPSVGGVETRVIAARVDAGEDPQALAEDYDLPPEAILDALVFESALARAA